MSDPGALIAALQFGDSAFPSGGFAFSWGLEGLSADGFVTDGEDVAELIDDHLVNRWNRMDRILLRDAFAAIEPGDVIVIDRLADAATLSEEMRSGSRRAGRALLGIFARLGHAGAGVYRARIETEPDLGHLPVIQGLVFREAALSRQVAETLSGWQAVSGFTSAAIRLGLIGSIEAQRILIVSRQRLGGLLAEEPQLGRPISSFTPFGDIAVSRNVGRHLKLFVT